MIFWTPSQGLGHFSRSASVALTAYLDSEWLHSSTIAVLGGHLIVLASPKCWDLLRQLGWTFSNSLSYALFTMPTSISLHNPFRPGPSTTTEAVPLPMAFPGFPQCQALAALHDSIMSKKPVPFGWFLHTTKSSYFWNTGTQPFFCCFVFFVSFQKACHHSDTGLLITDNFLAPANQHQFSQ